MNRLLIIEDDPNTLTGLQELLSQEGYSTRGVMRGRDAYQVVASEPIDVVLCDYCLPDGDGVQLCGKLKRLRPQLSVFLVTAYRSTDIVNAAKSCGVDKIIDKPIMLDELLTTIAASAARENTDFQYLPSVAGVAATESMCM
jgi:DNA-binding response OmpR family regulator